MMNNKEYPFIQYKTSDNIIESDDTQPFDIDTFINKMNDSSYTGVGVWFKHRTWACGRWDERGIIYREGPSLPSFKEYLFYKDVEEL